MFRKLFNPDTPLMIVMGQISDCICLSLFFVVCCFPVVTVGASTVALYDATYRTFRKGEKNSWQRFFSSFRAHVKAGILPSAVLLAGLAALAYVLIGRWNAAVAGTLSWALFSALAFLGVTAFGMLSVMCPLLSRFETDAVTLVKNTLLLSLANLPRTVVLGLLNTAALFLCVLFVFPFFFLPALAALIGSLFLEPMFKPYMPAEPEETEETEE